MADVKWIKIVVDIFDDEKILLIESMPEADAIIVIWFKLLCLAGKQNNGGVFMLNDRIPYSEEMFATIFRRNINTVRMAMHIFEEFGMIEIINNTVTIPNWNKHQSLDSYEKRKQLDREYQKRRYQEKKMKLLTENSTETSTENYAENSTETSTDLGVLDKKEIRKEKKEKGDEDGDGINTSENVNPFGEFDPQHQLDPDSLVAYAASNLRSMNNDNMNELMSFRDSLSDEMIRHAINEACGNGAPVYNYVRSILNSYVENGFKSMADVKAYEDRKRKKGAGKTTSAPEKTYAKPEDFY